MEREPTDIVQLKLRIREDLRQRLEDAAKASKISLNAAIIERIEKTFAFDTFMMPMGRQDLFWICSIFVGIIRTIEDKTGKRWTEDLATSVEARNTMVQFLTKSPSAPSGLGDMVARALIEALADDGHADANSKGESK